MLNRPASQPETSSFQEIQDPADRVYTTEELWKRLTIGKESFSDLVMPLYLKRHVNKKTVRDLIRRGLDECNGSYKILFLMFNASDSKKEYKRLLNFLRKHDLHIDFRKYRVWSGVSSLNVNQDSL